MRTLRSAVARAMKLAAFLCAEAGYTCAANVRAAALAAVGNTAPKPRVRAERARRGERRAPTSGQVSYPLGSTGSPYHGALLSMYLRVG